MISIKKKFVTDDANRKVAVLIDIADFERMEDVIENYGLYKLMQESNENEPLSHEEAQMYYKKLKKAK